MSHHKLKWIKDTLVCIVEDQLCDLETVDTNELGEVIDMIKDLEEAIYYATVTEAMKTGEAWEIKKGDHYENDRVYYGGYPMIDKDDDMMPIDGDRHDEKDGRSYISRRMYMEAKDMKRDKATQLRELEKYMQELSQDVVDMIADASVEEKQYLEKKITALASKISQMK